MVIVARLQPASGHPDGVGAPIPVGTVELGSQGEGAVEGHLALGHLAVTSEQGHAVAQTLVGGNAPAALRCGGAV
ncbi:hypothetical protein SDC9_210229 [bioreactor metagenome]|uniref:Uncharacterized protein n=1 Tax=bioreactor metagenome TaxID=1076179 RepID=A0A645JH97_9ZZZZ